MKIYKKIITLSLVISLLSSESSLYADWKRWAVPLALIMTSAASQVAAQSDCDCSSDTNYTDPNVVTGYSLAFVAVAGCVWSGFTGAVVWMCTRCNDSCTGETGLERGAYCHNLFCGCCRGYKESDWKRRTNKKSIEKLVTQIQLLLGKGEYKAAQLLIEGEDLEVKRKLIKDRVFDQVALGATSAERGAKGKFKKIKDWVVSQVRSDRVGDAENQLHSVHETSSSGDPEEDASKADEKDSVGSWAGAASQGEEGDPAADTEKKGGEDKPRRGLSSSSGMDIEEED